MNKEQNLLKSSKI